MKYGDKAIEKFAIPENWEIWDAPVPTIVLYQKFPEFTCLCPRSGYPDFATIHIISVPHKKLIELKCLKLWLNSFRSKKISHENAISEIVATLYNTLGLKYIWVLMEYTPRGNLTTYLVKEILNTSLPRTRYIFGDIDRIKNKVISNVI